MIKIPLSTEDLTRLRLVPSPLWESVCSFGVLAAPQRHSLHSAWAGHARLALGGVDLSPLVAAMGIGGRCPDYLSPSPETTTTSFRDELERLRATPPEVVHADVLRLVQEQAFLLDRLPSEKARMLRVLDDPEGSLRRLVDALDQYHDLAIAPYWSRISELLESDVLLRGKALVLGGADLLFSSFEPCVRYRGGALELANAHEAVVETESRGLTLVPCVFSWPNVYALTQPSHRPTLAYPPRGMANLWRSSPIPSGTALGAALSEGRASVLKGIVVPRTTTDLARQLGMSPSAVSAHLSRLRTAGLTESHRNGRNVFYRLTGAGESLLAIFGETG